MARGTQGQILGVTKLEVWRCVPLHGIGILATVEVMAGADSTEEMDSAAILPLTFPPVDLIDCHDPL